MGSVGYTQVSPMKNIQFVGQKKRFFKENQHHKQNEHIFGTQVQARGGYGNEAVSIRLSFCLKKQPRKAITVMNISD